MVPRHHDEISMAEQACSKPLHSLIKTGAARGIRTPDPIITNDVLYQLSYCGARCYGPNSAMGD